MADNKSSGQDTRLPGASDFFPAPTDLTASKGGPISAKDYKRSKKPNSALEETSPESSIGKPVCSPSIGSPPSAKVTKRTHFTPQQIYKLEQFFLKSQFPTAKDRGKLATELRLSAKHIQVWFQNHRAKYKRKEKKKEAQKSTVKLQPPSSWPSKLPFDSSIATIGSSSNKLEVLEENSDKKETASERTGSASPDHSVCTTTSEEISGSTMYSSLSSETLVAYPLSPSSPLPTPHAPMRGQSSSLAPDSPLSSVCSSPVPSQSINIVQSPASSTTTTSQDSSQVYTSDISALNLFDINFQTNDFSPPIFAESPVHLYDLLDDPEIASILREHLSPPKKISITESSELNLPHGSSYESSPSYYQTSLSQVGYGPSQQFHSPPPTYSLPSITDSQQLPVQSQISPSNPTIQQMHPLASEALKQQSLSHLLQSNPRSVRPLYPQNNPYHPPMVLPMHASGPFSNIRSPQYPIPPQNHPLAQVYHTTQMTYQARPPMPTIDPRYQHHPSHHHHPQLLSLPMTTQVQAPLYHQQTNPSNLPHTPVTVSVSSSILYQQPPNQKAPAR